MAAALVILGAVRAEAHGSLTAEARPQAGTPGSTVVVTGQTRAPGSTIEAHWNAGGGALVGSSVAMATGLFSLRATVPAVAPGVYYLVIASGGAEPATRAAFEVTASGKGRSAGLPVAALATPGAAAALGGAFVLRRRSRVSSI